MEFLMMTMMIAEVFMLIILVGLGWSDRPQRDGRRDKQAR